MAEDSLIVRGAREHNLRNIDVTIPRDKLTVITGLSGSGKSSLAFDTIYAEGQRRYVESLSAYARQFLGLMEKPDVDSIEGLSPAISIEQKTAGHNPRSTVGTVTEIYDYLRLLCARAGTPHCPNCGRAVQRQSAGADRRDRARLAARLAHRGSRAARAGPKGRVPRAVRVGAQAGLHSRVRRRRADRGRRRRRSSTAGRTTPSRSSSTGSSCAPKIARASSDSVETALKLADGVVEVSNAARRGSIELFSERYGCPTCGISLPELEPRHFSFNSPFGACSDLRRTRHAAPRERAADPRRPAHLDSRGRDSPVGRAERISAQGRAAGAGASAQVRPQRAVGRHARSPCATRFCTATSAQQAAKRRATRSSGKA